MSWEVQKEGSSNMVGFKALVACSLLFRVRNSKSSWCFSSESEIRDRADVKSEGPEALEWVWYELEGLKWFGLVFRRLVQSLFHN